MWLSLGKIKGALGPLMNCVRFICLDQGENNWEARLLGSKN
jgi:hypothetical protein